MHVASAEIPAISNALESPYEPFPRPSPRAPSRPLAEPTRLERPNERRSAQALTPSRRLKLTFRGASGMTIMVCVCVSVHESASLHNVRTRSQGREPLRAGEEGRGGGRTV